MLRFASPLSKLLDAAMVLGLIFAISILVKSQRIIADAEQTIAAVKSQNAPPSSSAPISPAELADDALGKIMPDLLIFGASDDHVTASPRLAESGAQGLSMVLIFRSDCRFCEETAPDWRRMTSTIPTSVRLVVVNAEDKRTAGRWLSRHNILPGEVWIPVDLARYAEDWGIRAVPATLLLDRDGQVIYAHFGVLTPAQEAEIEELVGTKT